MKEINEKITTAVKSNCLATKLNLIQELRQDMEETFIKSQNGKDFLRKTISRDGIRRIIQSVN